MTGFDETIVWADGEDGLHAYCVYASARTGNGTVLAAAEGRIGARDDAPHHLVMKRSFDGGATWMPNQYLVASDDGQCYANPTLLVDRRDARVFLFYARNFGQRRTEVFYITSDDDGGTWSAPTTVTELFAENPHGWTFHLPGPGHGLQTAQGRLLLQVWHRRAISFPPPERRYGVSVLFCDDAGGEWRRGATLPLGEGMINESRVVQLADGRLLLNARSGPFVTSRRYVSRSRDMGETWTTPRPDVSLPPSYATDAGLLLLESNGRRTANWLAISRPNDPDERKGLTLGLSSDEGASWHASKTIFPGPAHYSDLVELADGKIGVLYGRGLKNPDERVEGNVREVAFARVDAESLGGAPGARFCEEKS